MDPISYPRLIRRVRAFLLDSVLLPIVALASLIGGHALELVKDPADNGILVLLPIFILDPLLVAWTGGTVGHHVFRLRVTRMAGTGNINLLAATLRFIVKSLFGWVSFIFVLTTVRRQAFHDVLARSIVVLRDPAGLPAREVLSERRLEDEFHVYPPAWRRIVVSIGYLIGGTLLLSLLTDPLVSEACNLAYRCTPGEHLFQMAVSVVWLIGTGWVAVRGWNGRLYGCRKHPKVQLTG